jgi:hypothetical protein
MNKSTIRYIGSIFFFVSLVSACASHKEMVVNSYAAPVLLPGTISEMNTAGFWIGIHPDPDRVVIPAERIAEFNKYIRRETRTVQDIISYPDTVKGNHIAAALKSTLQYVSSKKYVQQDGRRTDSSFFRDIEDLMNITSISSRAGVKFGFVTTYTPQRLLPTNTELYSSMKSIDIDRLQNSALDIGTPLVILHTTGDGNWVYTVAPLCEGWVRAENVGLCSRAEMASYVSADPFIVTTGIKTDLFFDDDLRTHHAYVRMGCRFPSKETELAETAEIVLPFRDQDGRCVFKEAYASGSDVSLGYLPYTPRTIILQAFKLLNCPYGWGDMHGEQDCSRFIQEIFSTVGIQLPRNSLQQARVGRLIARFKGDSSEKKRLSALSDNSIGGISILQMNGHIMLFLGNSDGDPYAIHDMQGYSEPSPEGERLMVVNRVVVSNLRIGEGTRSGPFLKRLVTVRAFEIGSS